MRRNSILIMLCALALGLMLGGQFSPTQGAAPVVKTPSPVEVVNFPQVQGVGGTVNVGNFPPVQGVEVLGGSLDVAGQVSVANLPVDAQGNVRVAVQDGNASSAILEFVFHETDRQNIGHSNVNVRVLPLIPLPPGFSTASIAVYSLDTTKAIVVGAVAGFGLASTPPVHTPSGDLHVFPQARYASVSQYVTGDASTDRWQVAGTHLQLTVYVQNAAGDYDPIPPDTPYYVLVYLTH